MRVVITGGGGFLGRKLAGRVSREQAEVDEIRLLDQSPPPDDRQLDDPRISLAVGDITDDDFLRSEITEQTGVVYHLASVVSAGAEMDFDLGYRVNLHGTLAVLERCRRLATRPKVVFTSSCAAYGSDAGAEVDDATSLRPETSYGVQKATGELLINDYTRKGFIDGRTLRLPTVAVRPGKPNLAASGFASGVIREPLAGLDTVCPVRPDTAIAVISPRRVIEALTTIPSIDGRVLGPDRTVQLPGLRITVAGAIDAVAAAAAASGLARLGRVSFEPDEQIQSIVESWPASITSRRANELGFAGDPSIDAIVAQHIEDELEA